MEDQIGYATLIVLDEGYLRIDNFVEKPGFGFGKDFQKALAGKARHQPVAVSTNRENPARCELILACIGVIQLGIQLDGLPFFGRFIGDFLCGLVEAILVQHQTLHFAACVCVEGDLGVDPFVEKVGLGFREDFQKALAGELGH